MTSKEILQQWQALKPQREALLDQIDELLAKQRKLMDEYSQIIGLPGGYSNPAAKENLDQRIELAKKHNALSEALIVLYDQGEEFYQQYQAALEAEQEVNSCDK